MTQEQAISIIEQALNIATSKGVFNLADVDSILKAIIVIKNGKAEES